MPARKGNNHRPDGFQLPGSRKPRLLVVGDAAKPRIPELAARITRHLEKRTRLLGVDMRRRRTPITGKPDLVVVLGGDGAMLAVSHRLGSRRVPVLGVNFGSIGFLAAVSPERALPVLELALTGKGVCEEHAMMHARVRRGRRVLCDTHILNEVVVRAEGSAMAEVGLTVDRRAVATYRGDGLIVATATGSTAYNLAAGGPVMSPRLDAWVVTPIAPHMLGMRPLVLPGRRVAWLAIHKPAVLTADGHETVPLEAGDTVRVGPSNRTFRLVVDPQANFFARLRSKLLWGEQPGPG